MFFIVSIFDSENIKCVSYFVENVSTVVQINKSATSLLRRYIALAVSAANPAASPVVP